jgi:hypothetical protein
MIFILLIAVGAVIVPVIATSIRIAWEASVPHPASDASASTAYELVDLENTCMSCASTAFL